MLTFWIKEHAKLLRRVVISIANARPSGNKLKLCGVAPSTTGEQVGSLGNLQKFESWLIQERWERINESTNTSESQYISCCYTISFPAPTSSYRIMLQTNMAMHCTQGLASQYYKYLFFLCSCCWEPKSNHFLLLPGAMAQKLLSSTLLIAGCNAVLLSNPLHLHFVQPFSKALQICVTVYHTAQARWRIFKLSTQTGTEE